jgi:decaprenylphospho-beta-D-erythro-pentofuranosid-2-ulose 2-reductase
MRDGLGSVDSVLLVGGTSEIGLALVRRLAPRRSLFLMGRDPDAMASAARSLGLPAQVEIVSIAWDAAETAGDSGIFDELFRRNDIDTTVIAAGVLGEVSQQLDEPSTAVAMGRVTYLGAMSALLHSARSMRQQGHGDIIVLSSFAVVRPRLANFVYGSAKAGLDYLSRGLAESLRGSGVDLLIVRPGFVHTRMTRHLPGAPMSVQPDDVADVVVKARRRRQTVVYAPRMLMPLAVAFRVLPRSVIARLGN